MTPASEPPPPHPQTGGGSIPRRRHAAAAIPGEYLVWSNSSGPAYALPVGISALERGNGINMFRKGQR